jgi:ABC-type multidrug transport system fused ATPase/permease subunit
MLANPEILILDEATSSLDSGNETLVQEALDRLLAGRTAVVIAHRLSTIKNADAIVVLQSGNIVEKGTHQELIGKGGVYTTMVNMQHLKQETS